MARPKGIAKTGGRQKGVRNKATAKREAEVKATGLAPLDYMLGLLRDETAPPDMRFEAAKAAAPYVHPKLANIEHSGKDGKPLTVMLMPMDANL